MIANSLNEVISQLDSIIEESISTNSRAGYFASLYKRMTVAVKNGIDSGMFENGQRMEKLDVNFANRYFEAYEAWKKNEPTTESWKIAFECTGKSRLVVLQHLLLGINAHINLDLGLSAAKTSPGIEIESMRNDFEKVNNVIGTLVNKVQGELSDICWPMKFIENVSNQKDDAVINFSIKTARQFAWTVAITAAQMNESQTNDYLKIIDKQIAIVAKNISNPGFFFSFIQMLIKIAEDKGVSSVIKELNK